MVEYSEGRIHARMCVSLVIDGKDAGFLIGAFHIDEIVREWGISHAYRANT